MAQQTNKQTLKTNQKKNKWKKNLSQILILSRKNFYKHKQYPYYTTD